ncbi:MAG: ATP-dependent sacrificial sulfur transferase LarE [Planctomycetota bacterium]
MSAAADPLGAAADRLVDTIAEYESCVVAFSAGVDSAVVSMAAHRALGDRAVAVTGVGPALPEGELEAARELAALIGIRHVETPTDEIERSDYVRNATDRCYHCKTELYGHLQRIARELSVRVIVNGTNTDDLGDHRPGLVAASEHAVRSPLVDCEVNKDGVRRLAAHWGLPVWDKPAAPCLASRVAYGVEVTPERLRRIDRAEQWLRGLGMRECRVRHHADNLARVEAPLDWVARLATDPLRGELVAKLTKLGFRAVTIDLAGFRSGSLNTLVPLERLEAGAKR